MLLTNHVLSGALIGARPATRCPRSRPGWPRTSSWTRCRTGATGAASASSCGWRADGRVSLAIMGTLTAASPPGRRAAVLAGHGRGALPDADKPTTVWFGGSPFPAAVDRFDCAHPGRVVRAGPRSSGRPRPGCSPRPRSPPSVGCPARTPAGSPLTAGTQADQGSQVAEGDLEHRRRVLEREPHVAEHLHRHRPVQQRPAAQERQQRAEREAGAQPVPVAAELVTQPGVDLRVVGTGNGGFCQSSRNSRKKVPAKAGCTRR